MQAACHRPARHVPGTCDGPRTLGHGPQAEPQQYEISKEEMRAANEELQSINEELLTVNQENKSKIDELSQLTSDLQSLLASTDIATLFLDRDMRIKRFTPRIAEVFNVLTGGREAIARG